MANKAWNWMLNPDFLAQAGHAELGALAVLGPLALWPGALTPGLVGTVAAAAYGAVKEAILDPVLETDNPFWPVGAIDLAFIMGGSAAAWALYGLTHHWFF